MTTEPTLPGPTLPPQEALEQYLASEQEETDLAQHILELQRRLDAVKAERHEAERRLARALPSSTAPFLFLVLGMAYSVVKVGKGDVRVVRLEPAPTAAPEPRPEAPPAAEKADPAADEILPY